MFLPLSDQPNPRGVPYVNYVLIGANVLIFLLVSLPLMYRSADPADPDLAEYVNLVTRQMGERQIPVHSLVASISAYDLFLLRHGFRPSLPQWQDLLSSMFLHGGWLHLFGNMLFLWIYGDNVEHRLGRGKYLLAYLGTGIAATLVHAAIQPHSPLPTVGASGAISGVLGFYFVWFPKNRVRVLIFLFPFFSQIVLLPARVVLGIYLVLDNLLPFLLTSARGGGVAYGAHIGGFLAGGAAAYLGGGWSLSRRPASYRRVHPPAAGEEDRIGKDLREAIRAGRTTDAVNRYFQMPRPMARRQVSPEELLLMADRLREGKQSEPALFLYQRLLADYPRSANQDRAHLGAGLVQFYGKLQPAAAYQHFLAVLDLDPSPQMESLARQEIARIQHLQKLQLKPKGD